MSKTEQSVLDSSCLPTHMALVVRRLNRVGPCDSANTFLYTSYVAESFIKTIVLALRTGLKQHAPEHAYRIAYNLVRADGLGAWEEALRQMTSMPLAGFFPPDCGSLVTWASQRRGGPEHEWAAQAYRNTQKILELLGTAVQSPSVSRITVNHTITALVQIRNKTKAHGAVGEDFYYSANAPYIEAIRALIGNCPALAWRWLRFARRANGTTAAAELRGVEPRYLRDADISAYRVDGDGIHFVTSPSVRPYACADMLRCDRECNSFFLPNGGERQSEAEFIDYATGKLGKFPVSEFSIAPAKPPESETHGARTLDIQSNTIGNLPPEPQDYVRRPTIESELFERLIDRNHAILTLHGPGGVGKTYLALRVAHELARRSDSPFEYTVWFSARDVDLTLTGPKNVAPAVTTLEDVCRAYGSLFSADPSTEAFAAVLQNARAYTRSSKGILFVFDNFETLGDVAGLHRFLDTHTHLPNKVLITSRERAFKADYPIEVRGMEYTEAEEMLSKIADTLNIRPLLNQDMVRSVYDFTAGHAYIMRVICGEIAKEGRPIPVKSLMASRGDIVQAVFERSFNKLTDAGRWVFLLVSNYRSAIAELALLAVAGRRSLAVEDGINECVRLSLISRDHLCDGQPCYSAPPLARVFGTKKLKGDPDQLLVKEDLEAIRAFGVVGTDHIGEHTQEELVRRFTRWCLTEARVEDELSRERVGSLLEATAELWPPAWLSVAHFWERSGGRQEQVEYALRRAVEEMPNNMQAWIRRAKYAELVGDEATRIASLVNAVEASPEDVELVRDVAFELCKYVNDHLNEIPKTRRGVYLASVRSHMMALTDRLDATGLSRLAWLFLLEDAEDAKENAWRYANEGCSRDPTNSHCIKILERLDSENGP